MTRVGSASISVVPNLCSMETGKADSEAPPAVVSVLSSCEEDDPLLPQAPASRAATRATATSRRAGRLRRGDPGVGRAVLGMPTNIEQGMFTSPTPTPPTGTWQSEL